MCADCMRERYHVNSNLGVDTHFRTPISHLFSLACVLNVYFMFIFIKDGTRCILSETLLPQFHFVAILSWLPSPSPLIN